MKSIYKDLIAAISDQLAESMCAHESQLAQRASCIDAEVEQLTREIGLQTTRKVLEHTRDRLVKKTATPG